MSEQKTSASQTKTESQQKNSWTRTVSWLKAHPLVTAVAAIILVLSAVSPQWQTEENLSNENEDNGPYWHDDGGDVSNPGSEVSGTSDHQTISGDNVYQFYPVADPQAGIVVANMFLPLSWRAAVEGSWQVPSAAYPGVETVSVHSPDNGVLIALTSPQEFKHFSSWSGEAAEGINSDGILDVKEKSACEVVEMELAARTSGGTNNLLSEEKMNELEPQLQTQNNSAAQSGVAEANALYGQWVTVSVQDTHVDTCRRRYDSDGNIIEIAAAVMSVTTNMQSSVGVSTVATSWTVPFIMTYATIDQETFDQYYPTFQNIVANSSFTSEFAQAVGMIVAKKNEQVAALSAARSQASLEASRQQTLSDYTSTNERVMDMWDSVIKEEDAYTDLNGNRVTTSMYNETVAQDGDKFYVGPRTGVPHGFSELHKEY